MCGVHVQVTIEDTFTYLAHGTLVDVTIMVMTLEWRTVIFRLQLYCVAIVQKL